MPHEILTPAETYQADEAAKARGLSLETLIDNAGRAVAEEIARRFGARPTVVLCGPGNNGKDGKVAAAYLKRWGWPVRVGGEIAGAELIIDALFGAGLSRDFPQALADKINSPGAAVVAIDVPSGLDGLTGRPRGACVKADVTVTFFRKKPAHVLLPGRALCGDIAVADIGIPEAVLDAIKPTIRENAKPSWPALTPDAHKYRRGHVLVVSGPHLNTGAARLAAQAAQRAGAGLVTIAGDVQALSVHAAHVTSIRVYKARQPLDYVRQLNDKRINAVCIGPAAGVGVETMAKVYAILGSAAHVVLDADALTSFAQNPAELFEMIRQRPPGAATVMTPHAGEFARLFKGISLSSDSKIEHAQRAARSSGAILLLKGADTVITAPDGRACVNTNAPPSLATAGSGDVLAGLISGLLAQGMPAFEAACGAAWLHGNTAARLPARGLIAEDLIQNLRFDE